MQGALARIPSVGTTCGDILDVIRSDGYAMMARGIPDGQALDARPAQVARSPLSRALERRVEPDHTRLERRERPDRLLWSGRRGLPGFLARRARPVRPVKIPARSGVTSTDELLANRDAFHASPKLGFLWADGVEEESDDGALG